MTLERCAVSRLEILPAVTQTHRLKIGGHVGYPADTASRPDTREPDMYLGLFASLYDMSLKRVGTCGYNITQQLIYEIRNPTAQLYGFNHHLCIDNL